jgi:hypothetical protein
MISAHITYKEATFSAIATRKSILNVPNEAQLRNMQILAEVIFEPLREGLGGKPIKITSFFRSPELNNLIGGSRTSQHTCNEGAAMDLDNEDPSNLEIFNYIRDKLTFDQLIWEYGDNVSPGWIHVSYHENNNRNQILRCINGNYYML